MFATATVGTAALLVLLGGQEVAGIAQPPEARIGQGHKTLAIRHTELVSDSDQEILTFIEKEEELVADKLRDGWILVSVERLGIPGVRKQSRITGWVARKDLARQSHPDARGLSPEEIRRCNWGTDWLPVARFLEGKSPEQGFQEQLEEYAKEINRHPDWATNYALRAKLYLQQRDLDKC